MARRAPSRFIRPKPRSMVWLSLFVDIDKVAVPVGSGVLLATLNAAALALRPFTVTRTRGTLWTGSDQSAATEEPQISFGMIKVSDQAAAIGVTAVPSPFTDTDAPWFVYETAVPAIQLASTVGFNTPAGRETVIDSKAQRIVGVNEDVALVINNSSAADGAVCIMIGRMLVKLH